MSELEELKSQMKDLEQEMISPDVFNSPQKIAEISKYYNQIREKISRLEKIETLDKKIAEIEVILMSEKDPGLLEMAQIEIADLKNQKNNIGKESTVSANGQTKNVIVEIRAGTGGEEAALFATNLYRMYSRFAERRGWLTELLSTNRTGIGGFKEVVFKINGKGAYESLVFESGVHRVQRIPETEKSGRVHTSTASVAVLPEATEVDIKIKSEDLEIDTYRSSGKGGQNVQKVETAVRITHRPTGLIVACQEERSQARNKEKAMKILMAKLLAQEEEKMAVKLSEQRRLQIGQAKRVEKIRTYNFPQNRVTDHRINKSWFNIAEIMDGKLDEMVKDLSASQ